MNKVTLKVNEAYKSIPEGFIWKDIPLFAIITGVNGVGKTQLLEILNKRNRNGDIDCLYELKNEDGVESSFILSSPQIKQLNIQGLITYYNESDQRITNLEQWNETMLNWNNRLEWLNYNLEKNNLSKEESRRQIQERNEINNSIRSYRQKISNTIIFAYEEELKQKAIKTNKRDGDLTEKDIRRFANPYFNTFTEIDDFERYITQEHEEYKDKIVNSANRGDLVKIDELRKEEKPYQTINRLFKKYGFGYFEMLNPFPEDKERNGEIKFKGQSGEVIDYYNLSSGEQMIVKFIIWSLGRDISGARINTLILDEPDAHLHPTMSKMMIDILSEISQPKELGGGGIRVILSTHSPSTVAFAPTGSLFVMEKAANDRTIKPTSTEEAVRILSDGIFTYEKAIGQFTVAANSTKSNILFVEGKTDVNHIMKAIETLGYNLDLEIIDMHDAGALSSFIRSTPANLFNKKKLLALFDCDKAGLDGFKDIKGDVNIIPPAKRLTAEQCKNKSFVLTIQPPKKLEKYCPIEFLYPFQFLKSNNVIEKRDFRDYKSIFNSLTLEEDAEITVEFTNETSLRPFKVLNAEKNRFSESIKSEKDPALFENFRQTIELINNIISYE